MKFIDVNEYGAKSSRITYNHQDSKLKVTLYPMLCRVSPGVCQQLSNEFKRCRYILHEDFNWNKPLLENPMYNLAADRLNLVMTADNLVFPNTSELINVDIPYDESIKNPTRLGLHHRLFLKIACSAIALMRKRKHSAGRPKSKGN